MEARAAVFREKVDSAAAACERADFATALRLYGEAVALDPTNHVLYSNRSAIFCRVGRLADALRDAESAIRLKPTWTRAFSRKGSALKLMGEYSCALVAFASGLAHDPKNGQLLSGIVDCARQSSFGERFGAVYAELEALGLHTSPFVLASVVGQELLSTGETEKAAQVLECALRIDTTSLRLRQAVLSCLSSAFWSLANVSKAAHYMQLDLQVATSLGDDVGLARAHANLGMVALLEGDDPSAMHHYRNQADFVIKSGDQESAVSALSLLGQLYVRCHDYASAQTSYEQCLEVLADVDAQGRRPMERAWLLCSLGHVHLARRSFDAAQSAFDEFALTAATNADAAAQAAASAAIAQLCQRRGQLALSERHLLQALQTARRSKNSVEEAVLFGSLSDVSAAQSRWPSAKRWAERQLQASLALADPSLEAQACGRLGALFQRDGAFANARRLHGKQLQLAESAGDRASALAGRHNLALCTLALDDVEEAARLCEQQISTAKKNGDRHYEALAHDQLAAVCKRTGNDVQALVHLHCFLTLSQDSGDVELQVKALSALGQSYVERADFDSAIEHLDKMLMLAQESDLLEDEMQSCHLLGAAFLKQKQYREAARYFGQQLAIAKDLKHQAGMAEAYGCLGEAHLALAQFDDALECQKYHLALAHIASDTTSKLRALLKIGQILLQKNDHLSSMKVLSKGLKLSHVAKEAVVEADFYGVLGDAYFQSGRRDKALAFYTQKLAIGDGLKDSHLQAAAFDSIGKLYRSQRKTSQAVSAFSDQLQCARRGGSAAECALALHNVASTCVQAGLVAEALRACAQADSLVGGAIDCAVRAALLWDGAAALEQSGSCVAAVRKYEEYVRVLEAAAAHEPSTRANCVAAYRRIALIYLDVDAAHEAMGSLQAALGCAAPHEKLRCDVLRDLIAACCRCADYAEALKHCEERRTAARACAREALSLLVDLDTAKVSLQAGNGAQARSLLVAALSEAQRSTNVVLHARCLLFEAQLEVSADNFAGATTICHRLLQILSSAPAVPPTQIVMLESWFLLGLVNMRVGDVTTTAEAFEQALSLSALLRRTSFEAKVHTARALHLWRSGNVRECEKVLDSVAQTRQTAPLVETILSGCTERRFEFAATLQIVARRCEVADADAVALQALTMKTRPLLCLLHCERLRRGRIDAWAQRRAASSCLPPSQLTLSQLAAAIDDILVAGESLLYSLALPFGLHICAVLKSGAAAEIAMMQRSDSSDAFECKFASFYDRTVQQAVVECATTDWRPTLAPDTNLCVVGVRVDDALIGGATVVRRLPWLVSPLVGGGGVDSAVRVGAFVCAEPLDAAVNLVACCLNARADRADEMAKEAFLRRLALCRCAHLRLPVCGDGLRLKSNDAVCDNSGDEDAAVDDVVSPADILASRCGGAAIVLDADCSAVAVGAVVQSLLLSGWRTVIVGRLQRADAFWTAYAAGATVRDALLSVGADAAVSVYGDDDAARRSTDAAIAAALRRLLATPDDSREALRVILHLVEKSLQRINAAHENALYTSEQSIRNKVGPEVSGWMELLFALGFKSAKTDTCDNALYFPNRSHLAPLTRASKTLQALLGLPQNSLLAIGDLIYSQNGICDVLALLNKMQCSLEKCNLALECTVAASLYHMSGVHELCSSLGFDKIKDGADAVTLKTIRVELTRRKVQSALTAVEAVFSDILTESSCKSADYVDVIGEEELDAPMHAAPSLPGQLQLLDVTDMSGVDSDCSPLKTATAPTHGRKRSAALRHRRRSNARRSGGGGGGGGGGYASESDVRRRGEAADARDCRSEDEGGRARTGRPTDDGAALLAATARVLSVDERLSPFSDMGDSFRCDDDFARDGVNGSTLVTPSPATKRALPYADVAIFDGAPDSPFVRTPICAVDRQPRPQPPAYEAVVRTTDRPTLPTVSNRDASLLRSAACKLLSPRKSTSNRPLFNSSKHV